MAKQVRKGLTRASILKEAFALIDAAGADAFTMRALAQRLGVATMAVYNHYRDRDDILDALADRMFAELRDDAAPLKPSARSVSQKNVARLSIARLRAIVIGAQRLASRHPHIYRLAMTRPAKPLSAFQVTAEAMDALRGAGLNESQAITAYHTFLMLLQGFPFWQEAFTIHKNEAAGGLADICARSADAQFAACLNWLTNSLERLSRKRS